jgi:hypothetical protein
MALPEAMMKEPKRAKRKAMVFMVDSIGKLLG